MGHSSSSVTQASKDSAVKRHQRSITRSANTRSHLDDTSTRPACDDGNNLENDSQSQETTQQLEPQEVCSVSDSSEGVENKIVSTSTEVQTDLTCIDVEMLENKFAAERSPDESLSEDSFKDDEKVKFYTGLPTLEVMRAVLDLISQGLVQRFARNKFQQIYAR